MRRLLSLYAIFLVALWSVTILQAGEPTASVALRDGGLLLLLAGGFFGAFAFPRETQRATAKRPWPGGQRILFVIGLVVTILGGGMLAGGLLGWLTDGLFFWASLLWLAGLLLLAVAGLWPNRDRQTPKRGGGAWSVEAAQAYLAEASSRSRSIDLIQPSRRVILLAMGGLILLAAAIRIGLAPDLPGCSDAGCQSALTALDLLRSRDGMGLLTQDAPLYLSLVAIVFGLFSPTLTTLFWLGIGLGLLTLPFFYLAASRFVQPPTALVASLLLAVVGWHVTLSRSPDGSLLLVLLFFVHIWLIGWASQGTHSARWLLTGLGAAALLFAAPNGLFPLLLLWLVMAPGLRPWPRLVLYWLALAGGSMPRLAAFFLQPAQYDWTGQLGTQLQALLTWAFVTPPLSEAGISLLGFLGLMVLLRQIRRPQAQTLVSFFLIVLLFGLSTDLLTPLFESRLTSGSTGIFSALLVLLAAIGLEQLIGHFALIWRPVWRPTVIYAGAGLMILALLLGTGFSSLNGQEETRTPSPLGTASQSVDVGEVQQAVGRYLARYFATSVDNGGEENAVILVPGSLLAAPATQLAAEGVLSYANRIVPLDPVGHLPFASAPFIDLPMDGNLIYIVPANDNNLLNWVRALYPQAQSDAITTAPVEDSANNESANNQPNEPQAVEPAQSPPAPTLAYALTVTREEVSERQGLALRFYEGTNFGDVSSEENAAGEENSASQDAGSGDSGAGNESPPPPVLESVIDEPFSLDWQSGPPLLPPFSLASEGLLYLPESGDYAFSLASDPGATVSVRIGGPTASAQQLLLTEENASQQVSLTKGLLPIEIRYISGEGEPNFSIRWQRPGGKVEPLPKQALYQLPSFQGLQATYTTVPSNSDRDADERDSDRDNNGEMTLLSQREPVPGVVLATALSGEETVRWQGQIAISIQGTYAFAVGETGDYQFALDGITLIDTMPASEGASEGTADGATDGNSAGSAPVRRQASIQLNRGWHTVEIAYRPDSPSDRFQLNWQPPGTFGGPIPASRYLPYPSGTDMSAVSLPDMPGMARPPINLLPDTPVTTISGPGQYRVLSDDVPSGMPGLAAEMLWQVGSCGSGDGQLLAPRGVVLLPEANRVAVADSGNRRLTTFLLGDGSFEQAIAQEIFEEPFDIGRNILGDVFLLDAVSQQIYLSDLESQRFTPISLETSFYRPRGLGVDVSGTLIVADTGGARVVMLSPGGRVMAQFGGPDTLLGQGQPVDAIALPNGALWAVSAEDGRLWRLEQGVGWAVVPKANTFDAPHLAALTNSTFFMTDPERRQVLYMDVNGQPVAQFGQNQFAKPVGIDATLFAGNVLVAVSDSAACTVSVWQIPMEALP